MLSKLIPRSASTLIRAAEHGKTFAIQELIESGRQHPGTIPIDERDESTGDTALITAVRNNHVGATSMLLEAGANPHLQNKKLESASSLARSSRLRPSIDHIRFLLDKETCISAFFEAIKSGDTDEVESFLSSFPSSIKWTIEESGERTTGLYNAILCGHAHVAIMLMKAGADPGLAGASGLTPLHACAMVAEPDMDLINELLKSGADANAAAGGVKGMVPLHLAASRGHAEVCRALIDGGANVNAADTSLGWTALHRAANRSHIDVARVLIGAGCEINARHHNAGTPLHEAARLGRRDTVELLLQSGADPDLVDEAGRTCLHYAAHFGFGGVVACLCSLPRCTFPYDKHGNTPIHSMLDLDPDPDRDSDFVEMVSTFHEHGCDLNTRDTHGRTALMVAVCGPGVGVGVGPGPASAHAHGHGRAPASLSEARILALASVCDVDACDMRNMTVLGHAVRVGASLSVIAALLGAGYDVNHRDADDSTPLHYAADQGSSDIIGCLVAAGAHCAVSDVDGYTPLHLAIQGGFEGCCMQLIDAWSENESLNLQDGEAGETPLHLAAGAGMLEVVERLIECEDEGDSESGLSVTDSQGRTPLFCATIAGHDAIVRRLLECGRRVGVDDVDSTGLTVLHCAAGCGNPAVVQALIDGGADVNAVDADGASVLYECIGTALQFDLVESKRILEVVEILVGAGADVNVICHGLSPLHWAAMKGDERIAQILIDHGADPDALSEDGETPLSLAGQNGHDVVVRLLKDLVG